ncbi:MAG: methyltransferase domain-containing protein [Methylococcales bacterium]|jgi:SAM-dependent methyltransferase|nr:methyltransferase domain-containing protein [Methylococcales bacterium]
MLDYYSKFKLKEMEVDYIHCVLSNIFGYHIVQLSPSHEKTKLLSSSRIRHHVIVRENNVASTEDVSMFCHFNELAIASDSIDAVLLPHTLEYQKNSVSVLKEIERILIPEGRLVITGYNPISALGIASYFKRKFDKKKSNDHHQLIGLWTLNKWLNTLGFDVEIVELIYSIFPSKALPCQFKNKLLNRDLFELKFLPLYGVYIVVAQKRVSTITPIKPRWRPRRGFLIQDLVKPSARNKNE